MQVTDTVIGSITFTDSRDKQQTPLTNGSTTFYISRSQWPRCLRGSSATARLLRLWVRIPPGARMCVSFECCLLSGRGLCDELITRTEESYRLWCDVVGDLETSRIRRAWPVLGPTATGKKYIYYKNIDFYPIMAAVPAFETLRISNRLQVTKQVKQHIPLTTQQLLISCS